MKRHWYDELQTHTPDEADKIIMNPADSFNKVSSDCIELLEFFEGWHNEAYLDTLSSRKNLWTIGMGFTEGVKEGDYMTDEEIIIRLRQELSRFKRGVGDLINVKITQSMFDALVSFSFNLGIGALQNSTLRSLVNNMQYKEASDEFGKWVWAGGEIRLGLQRRRDAERLMFLGEDWRDYKRTF